MSPIVCRVFLLNSLIPFLMLRFLALQVYDLYFNECVRRQDTALDYHEFVTASLKVFPTVGKETRVPDGKKTKKQMFTGLHIFK